MSRRLLLPLLGVFVVYCGLTLVVPPFDDEFYYWCWAQTPQLSYYDHPPMTAYLITAATTLGGNGLFGLRLPACVASIVCFGIILHLTRPRTVAWWLLATPLFTFGAVVVTPDTPLILFWSAYLYWLVTAHEALTPNDEREGRIPPLLWLIGGVLLGCGVLGKYTTGLAVPAGFVAFLLAGNWRKWLLGYILHGVVAFAVASPILIHNLRHDFVPILYQWKHSMGTIDPSFKRFAEFLGIQFLLVGTMPLVLFGWVLWHARRWVAEPRLRVCFCLYALPFAFFLYKATRGPLEGNWALVSYIAFWPLAAAWYETVRHRLFWRIAAPLSFLLPGLIVVFAPIHLLTQTNIVPPAADRLTRQAEKFELAKQMADDIKARPEQLPVFTDTYQWVALLRYHGVDARQVDGITRPSHFTQKPEKLTDYDRAYVIWDGMPKPAVTGGFGTPTCEAIYPLKVRGKLLAGFALWRYEKGK